MALRKEDQICKKITDEINFLHKTKFKWQDLMEWTTDEIEPREDEVIYKTNYGVSVAFKKPKE